MDFPEVENVTSLDKHPAQEHVKKSVWEKLCRNSSSMLRSFSLTEGEQIWGLIFLSYFARHLLRLVNRLWSDSNPSQKDL